MADDLPERDGHAADGAVVRNVVVIVVGGAAAAALVPADVHDSWHADVGDLVVGNLCVAQQRTSFGAGKPLCPFILHPGRREQLGAARGGSCGLFGPRRFVCGHVVAEDAPERVLVVFHQVAGTVGDEDERLVFRVARGDDEAAVREFDDAEGRCAIGRRDCTHVLDAACEIHAHRAARCDEIRGGGRGLLVRHWYGVCRCKGDQNVKRGKRAHMRKVL